MKSTAAFSTDGAAPSTNASSLRSGGDTRERILDAAERLFAEQGYAGTSVRDLTKRVGLTPGSLYNHFGGKQELYEAVLERGIRPLLEVLQGVPIADESPPVAIEKMIEAIINQLVSRPHFPRLIQHEMLTGGVYLERIAKDWIRPLIDQGLNVIEKIAPVAWEEDEYPLLVTAWLQLVFGHFLMAPITRQIIGADPMAAEQIRRQTIFLGKLARMMTGPSPDRDTQA